MFKKGFTNSHTLIMAQIQDVNDCLVSFKGFLNASLTPETPIETLASLAREIDRLESLADISLRKMIDSLGANYLPSTRQELISVATACDHIANKCESIAHMAVCQKFFFPAEYKEEILKIFDLSSKEFKILEESISMLFSDFRKLFKNHDILDDVRRCESAVDDIENELYQKIFDSDKSLAEKQQCASFIEKLCDISDAIENIADKIQIILITRKS